MVYWFEVFPLKSMTYACMYQDTNIYLYIYIYVLYRVYRGLWRTLVGDTGNKVRYIGMGYRGMFGSFGRPFGHLKRRHPRLRVAPVSYAHAESRRRSILGDSRLIHAIGHAAPVSCLDGARDACGDVGQ